MVAIAFVAIAATACPRSSRADSDDAPIHYSGSTPHDPISQLQGRIDRGQVKFTFDPTRGYLESLLKSLKIPPSSQGLVFSKTSFQRNFITPQKPRAIYFNDDTYVGYVRNSPALEIVSMDRDLGAVFYVLEQRAKERPKFLRQTHECLICHENGSTRNVPGLLMRSVYPDSQGEPIFSAGTYVSSDQSPLSQRWGGWYVTGTCGHQRHMGNVLCDDEQHADQTEFSTATSNLVSLAKLVDTAPYLRSTSDAAALMVLAHQQHVHNLLTAANYDVRIALRDAVAMNKALGEAAGYRSPSTEHRIRNGCEPVVKALLFCGEVDLTDPIRGTSTYAAEFSRLGPSDQRGRSLRELDLTHRLFKFPCSYLIYSDQFDGLVPEAKSYILRRVWEVVTGRDDSRAFNHLSDDDRSAILDILRETKKDLPAYWKSKSATGDLPEAPR
ncbi:MAG TPA: hypothetical protein VFC46_11890 [Humisphaera sp.]|nr:hypothetical protein [Humisphaera sp.]